MAQKFRYGYVYLAKMSGMWWTIQQEGQRSWNAMPYTQITDWKNDSHCMVHGNATTLYEHVEGRADRIIPFNNTVALRKAMFNTLLYGTISAPSEEL